MNDEQNLLYEVGRLLWELEGDEIDCPLRDMRQKIEEAIKIDFRNYYKPIRDK